VNPAVVPKSAKAVSLGEEEKYLELCAQSCVNAEKPDGLSKEKTHTWHKHERFLGSLEDLV